MIEVSLINSFQLTVLNFDSNQTALYLIKNGEVVERKPYVSFNKFIFDLRSSGNYAVRWFKKNEDGSISRGQTDAVKFTGFTGLDRSSDDSKIEIALYGINPFTIYAAIVLAEKFIISGLIDTKESAIDESIFGVKIISPSQVNDARVIRYSADRLKVLSEDTFSTLPGRVDILSHTLNLFSIMELYRLERRLYLDGLLEGAKHIQGFIFNKFNSRVPYQAKIGEGTRIGIGGIGVVIHPDSVIGKNCVIAQHVTLGGRAGGNGTPIIGDNVWISPGAKCLGGRIGDNVVIGANSVVLHEVESNCVVAGAPAKVISRDMSKYSSYTGKNSS